MIVEKSSKNSCNANFVNKKIIIGSKLFMKRLEGIFDFYSEEPISIAIQETADSEEQDYKCILRMRIWNHNKKCCSWSIYAKERNEFSSLIIRKVVWDMANDEMFAKENIIKNRESILNYIPSINIVNKYIYDGSLNLIQQSIKAFDFHVENGFILDINEKPTWKWRDLEILRLYDWGQIHFTWCTEKKNENIEKKIQALILDIDDVLNENGGNIYSMVFNYSGEPDIIEKI